MTWHALIIEASEHIEPDGHVSGSRENLRSSATHRLLVYHAYVVSIASIRRRGTLQPNTDSKICIFIQVFW